MYRGVTEQKEDEKKERLASVSPNKVPEKALKKKGSMKVVDKWELLMEGIRADTLELADFTGAGKFSVKNC